MADDLEAFVRESALKGSSLYDVEKDVLKKVLAIGHAAIEVFLQAQGEGDLGERLDTQTGTVLYRSEQTAPRPLRTIFGDHCFQAYVYSRGRKRKIELRPIDARINLPAGKASYLLQEFSQMFCVEKAFGVGATQYEAVFGQKLSVDVLEGINRDMGEQADRFLEKLPMPAPEDEGAILVTTADGKGVPLVRADARQVPAFDKKERPGNRRMATLGCVYSVDPFVRTPEQIVSALFRDDAESYPEDRPEARFKHYRAFFAEAGETGADAVPSAYFTWSWMAQEVAAHHRTGQPIVRLMDGQPSLWEAAESCLSEVLKNLDIADLAPVVVDILDILHVSSYAWTAAKALYDHKEHREAFVEERLLRILRSDVSGVIIGMRRMATQQGLKREKLKAVTTACNYFEKNASRMRYDEYLRDGYPIASGVIEGACRHLIKDRMEQGGMRWTLEGAQAMLNVRSVSASSEWDHFCKKRQAEQAQRVHPHRELVANYKDFKA